LDVIGNLPRCSTSFPTFRHRFHHVLLLDVTFLDRAHPTIPSIPLIYNIRRPRSFKKFSDSSEHRLGSVMTIMDAGHEGTCDFLSHDNVHQKIESTKQTHVNQIKKGDEKELRIDSLPPTSRLLCVISIR
jgi:hypothetical protein